jgi:heme/copper-type cytochrome/quinol oxidase subunit 2
VLSVFTLQKVEATSDPSDGGVDIEVDGFQWQWQFRYLDGDSNPDNDYSVVGSPASPAVMVVPVGEPVRLKLVSRDVIHSFFVPQFLIKRDLIPFPESVTPNTLEFTVTEEGTYHGQCAEFCGNLHAQMTFSVQAMPRDQYDQWLADAKAGNTPQPSEQPTGETIELTAADISFDKKDLSVAADTAWTLRLINNDTVVHDVVIVDSNNTEVFRSGDVTGPGASGDFAVPALPAGEYTFYCLYHPVPDMTGTLTVQ